MLWLSFLLALLTLAGLAPPSLEHLTAACRMDVSGYQGTWLDPVKGVREIAYLAPDRLQIRDRSSGQIHGVHGTTVWDYDPVRQEAILTYNAPGPFGPSDAPTLIPGRQQLEHFLGAVQERYEIASEGEGEAAGRRAFLLRLTPEPGGYAISERLLWVDRETCLILREQGGTGFTAIRYEPPERQQMEVPVFPPGTMVTTHEYGTVQDLAAKAGFDLTEPSPLPEGWRFDHAYLTIYPDRGTGEMRSLSWYYYAGERTALAVSIWSPPRLQPVTGDEVLLAPGIRGHFFTAQFSGWPGLQWEEEGLSWSLTGPSISKAHLVAWARSILAGVSDR